MTVRPDPPADERAADPEPSSEASAAGQESQPPAEKSEPSEPTAGEVSAGVADSPEHAEQDQPSPEQDQGGQPAPGEEAPAEPAPGDDTAPAPPDEQSADAGEADQDPNQATPEEVSAGVADPEDAASGDQADRPEVDQDADQPTPEEDQANEVPGLLGPEEVVPEDDDFRREVEAQTGRIETPASILDELDNGWRGTRDEADAAHTEADGGMGALMDSWNDPAVDEARRRVGLPVEETRQHGESAGAMRDPIRGARDQLNSVVGERERLIEEGARQTRLAEATQPSPDRELTRDRILDLTVAGIRDADRRAAENITNDPRWAAVEAPPANPAGPDVGGLLTSSSTAAAAGADAIHGVRGDLSRMAAQDLAARGDFLDGRARLVDAIFDGRFDKWSQATKNEAGALMDAAAEHQGRADAAKSFSRGLKVGGAVAAPFAIAGAIDDYHNGESAAQAITSNAAGFGASVATGAAAGAVVGSFIPVPIVGTAVGAGVGALAGTAAGAFTSGAVDSLFQNGLNEVEDIGRAAGEGWKGITTSGQALWDGAKWLTGNG